MRPIPAWAAAPLAALSLTACQPAADRADGDAAAAPEPSSSNLAATLKGNGDLDSMEAAVSAAGLETVLTGVGPYTVFAPVDEAFESAGGALTGADLKAQNAALVRAHIVPGVLTRQDLAAALDRGGPDGVEMRTMAGDLLTFSREGETIVVTAPDGSKARLSGEQAVASNGVIQPVDAVLTKPGQAAPAMKS